MIPKLFLSKGLYGARRWNHTDLYEVKPGWLAIEAGSWTLEAHFTPGIRRAVARCIAIVGAVFTGVFSAAPVMAGVEVTLDVIIPCVLMHIPFAYP
jgi:hypothetical protein